jgi:1-aminocyclopropane-1-carboxylate deaminase
VLRLDLIDAYTGGNKLFKLKYNLDEVEKSGYIKMVTFGGAWSNHLAAVATCFEEAVNKKKLEVIAVVRGEEPAEYSNTLKYCREKGVKLHFVSRAQYKQRNEPGFIHELKAEYGDFYLLPEGGSNELAVKGCREILQYIPIDFNYICCPVGSGGTIAGIASGLKSGQHALGFVALKGTEMIEAQVQHLIQMASNSQLSNVQLFHDYHFGGFAKITFELLEFKRRLEIQAGFELDYVYTAKMFYGIENLILHGYFPAGSNIIALHTGGLQGNKGFEKY